MEWVAPVFLVFFVTQVAVETALLVVNLRHVARARGVPAPLAGAIEAGHAERSRAYTLTNGNLGHLPPCGYSPGEMQTAYDMNPLYAAGWDGTGQTVVITDAFGSDTIQQDAQVFSEVYGLPPVNLQVMRAPGASNNPHDGSWAVETTLDVEWVHAMAPNANIVLGGSGGNRTVESRPRAAVGVAGGGRVSEREHGRSFQLGICFRRRCGPGRSRGRSSRCRRRVP